MSQHLAVIIGLVAWVVITLVLFYRLYRLEENVSSDHYAPEWIVRVKQMETRVQLIEEAQAALLDVLAKQKTLKGKK